MSNVFAWKLAIVVTLGNKEIANKRLELFCKYTNYKLLMILTTYFPEGRINLIILGRVLSPEKWPKDLYFKGAQSGLRQFLATESPFKNDKKMHFISPKNRSSRPEVACKKGVLRNFAIFAGKHLYQSLFFNKVAGWGLQL